MNFWVNHGRKLILLDQLDQLNQLTHKMLKTKHYTVADQVQTLTLAEEGKSHAEISSITGISSSQITQLRRKARERGFNTSVSK